MKRKQISLSILLVLGISLAFIVGIGQAQGPDAPPETREADAAEASVNNVIPIQGYVTDAGGNPLDGDYTITATLYTASSGGEALCADDDVVTVDNGLFNMKMDFCSSSDIDGKALYLGIQVGNDPEMTPRQAIHSVPYAFSLRPGAIISDTRADAILHIENGDASGRGLRAYATSESGANYGVVGASRSPDGYGGYFYNTGSGIGLFASSDTGAAFKAGGTGIIQSAANSYIWISGNDLRKKKSSDTTQFELDTYGGVFVRSGGAGTRDVMLPVTLPGQLYGQNVTLTGIDVYFKSQGDFDGIDGTYVRRQTGAGSGDTIVADEADRVCTTACSYHIDLTEYNVLSNEQGAVYIAFRLFFGSSSNYVQIGSVRLTLEHN